MKAALLPLAAASLASFRWADLPPLPAGEAGGAVAVLGSEIVIAGGTSCHDGRKLWLPTTQIFDPQSRRWRSGPSLPRGMAYGAFVADSEHLEIFGGAAEGTVHRTSYRLGKHKQSWARSGEAPADVLLGGRP